MDIVAEGILIDVLSTFKSESTIIEDTPVNVFPIFPLTFARRIFIDSGNIFSEAVKKILKDGSKEIRNNLLDFFECLVAFEENEASEELKDTFAKLGLKFMIHWENTRKVRNELLIHTQRSNITIKERKRTFNIVERMWDGSILYGDLSDDFEIRLHQLSYSVKRSLHDHSDNYSPVLTYYKSLIEKTQDSYQKFFDSITICLVVLSEKPDLFNVTWNEFEYYITYLKEVKEQDYLLKVVNEQNEKFFGQRFEALNLLIIPLDNENSRSDEFLNNLIVFDKWAHSMPRYPGETEIHDAFNVAGDFLNRRDFKSVIDNANKAINKEQVDFYIKAQCLLLLARGYFGLNDYIGAIEALNQLEDCLSNCFNNNNSLNFLNELRSNIALKDKIEKILINISNQIQTLFWASRELRSDIYNKQNNTGLSIDQLIINFKEALKSNAWWLAFRYLVKICDMLMAANQFDFAFDLSIELENSSDDIRAKLLGKMQRAILYYYSRKDLDESIRLINEILPKVNDLTDKIPNKEIDGLFLWLKSILSWSYRDLENYEKAIFYAKEILNDSKKIESTQDISNSYELLRSVLLSAGRRADSYDAAKEGYYFCLSKDPPLLENAADSALKIVNQLIDENEMVSESSRGIILFWISKSEELYIKLKNEEKIKELSSIREKFQGRS